MGESIMSETVHLIANEGLFKGLAKQNLLFHQCVGELVDNAIAATNEGDLFDITIVLNPDLESEEYVELYIGDRGRGMSLDVLKRALQLGESATKDNRLNEHGFGLKNALATLSDGNGPWELWTRVKGKNESPLKVCGPFKYEMVIENEPFPNYDYFEQELSTLIKVRVKKKFLNTSRGRGGVIKDLEKLRLLLIEHLGVMYRGYLGYTNDFCGASGKISVYRGKDEKRVPYIPIPFKREYTEYFNLKLDGNMYSFKYVYGKLDDVSRDKLLYGSKVKYYYQGNTSTQGIDIRLGKRVIATRLLDVIWKVNGKPLERHNSYNDFVGELIIPDLPRGVLTTVNNKTDFNLADENWQIIFEKLNEFKPQSNSHDEGENQLKERLFERLQSSITRCNPETISMDKKVWELTVRIGIYRVTANQKVIIYDLKTGSGKPEHLYQLKMKWDGLVVQGECPDEAVLVVDKSDGVLERMAEKMNQYRSIKEGVKPYNFQIKTISDFNLREGNVG